MRREKWSLLALIGLLIVIGGVFLFKKVTVLCLQNMDRPLMIQVWISSSEPISLFYIHSIYREPVTEELQVGGEVIVLKGVRTKSPAVMEYYGFEDTEEFHPMNQRLGAFFVMKRGTGEGQGLMVRDKKIYLSEVGEKGDRIQLRVESMFLWNYLLLKIRSRNL